MIKLYLYYEYSNFIILIDCMSRAKKFFVIYSKTNMFKPNIYMNQSYVRAKIKHSQDLIYENFNSQIDAEKFIYPKKITYLIMEKQFADKGININDMSKIQKATTQQENINTSAQSPHQVQSQQMEPGEVSNPVKQTNAEISQESKLEGIQSTDKFNLGQVKHIPKVDPVKVAKTLKKNEFGFEVLQAHLQNVTMAQIMKTNVKKAYAQLLDLAGNPKQFTRSPLMKKTNGNMQYFGFFDGCCKGNPGKSGAGYFVVNSRQQTIFRRSINLGTQTNNQAQFMALGYLLMDSQVNGIRKLKVFGDSQLAINGLNGKYQVEDSHIKYYNLLNKYISRMFSSFQAVHIPRENNKQADRLSNLGVKIKFLGKNSYSFL